MILALEGLAHGDAFGETLQDHHLGGSSAGFRDAIATRTMPQEVDTWFWTDDTAMAIGVVEALLRWGTLCGECDDSDEAGDEENLCGQRGLAAIFARNATRLGPRQYSSGMAQTLEALAATRGAGWRERSTQGRSMGNGAAMRIAPLGAFFAECDPARIVEEATLATTVTHSHAEAVDGACVVALATAYLANSRTRSADDGLLEFVLAPLAPSSAMRELCLRMERLSSGGDFRDAAATLGNGEPPTCANTVPFALWSARRFLQGGMSFEDLMWCVASAGGDVDTNCAIVGGMVACHAEPSQLVPWASIREPLIVANWPAELLSDADAWPLGKPRTGRGLHPMCPVTIRF